MKEKYKSETWDGFTYREFSAGHEFESHGLFFYLATNDLLGNSGNFNRFADETERRCKIIAFAAYRGDSDARRHLARLAISLTTLLSDLAAKNPEPFRPVANVNVAWPVMDSPHPQLKSPCLNWEELELGAAFPVRFTAKRRFKLQTAAGSIAWELWLYVFTLKMEAEAWLAGKGFSSEQVEQIRGKLKMQGSTTATETRPIPEVAVLLPPFTNDSLAVAEWWLVAQRCLIAAFHKSDNANVLNELAPIFDGLVTSAAHKETSGRWRSRIIYKLSNAFHSIAGVPDSKKKK